MRLRRDSAVRHLLEGLLCHRVHGASDSRPSGAIAVVADLSLSCHVVLAPIYPATTSVQCSLSLPCCAVLTQPPSFAQWSDVVDSPPPTAVRPISLPDTNETAILAIIRRALRQVTADVAVDARDVSDHVPHAATVLAESTILSSKAAPPMNWLQIAAVRDDGRFDSRRRTA